VPSTTAIAVASSATCTDVTTAVRTPSFDAATCHQRSVSPGGGQAKVALELNELSSTSASGT
jgi:hypothetical protein